MGCASGVELTSLIGNDRENTRKISQLRSLRSGEAGRESMDGFFVGIEKLGGVRRRWKGIDDGGVPVVVRREKERLL